MKRLRMLFVVCAWCVLVPLGGCKDEGGAGPDGGSGNAAGGAAPHAGTGGTHSMLGGAQSGQTGAESSHAGGTEIGDTETGGTSADAGEPDPFAPGTFAAEHEAELQKDCQETVQCHAQMGMELPASPVEQCVHDSAVLLNTRGAERQQQFLKTFATCSQFVVCDYYNCALTNR